MKISDIPFIPLTDDELRMHGEMPALTRKRTQKGLSLRGLASLIDVAPSYLSALESGKKSNPSIRVCVAIATALDVELNTVAGWFLGGRTRGRSKGREGSCG